ncbi:hypothetical protein [Terribacillus sp. JSM ZJ617]|uniref:hypothetical protein n=1 Tax=Terribacillus sp. JSM ZJ617 TaxID=3342119 RepID=UPI0035A820D0
MALRERRRQRKREADPNHKWDILDILLWLPELLFLPLRLLAWIGRGILRLFQMP